MLSKWPIRVKLTVGLSLLLLVVAILAASSLYTTYAYRDLAKSLSVRVEELPTAATLARQVSDLRMIVSELRGIRLVSFPGHEMSECRPEAVRIRMARDHFEMQLGIVEETLRKYRGQLERKLRIGSGMADNQREWETMYRTEAALEKVQQAEAEIDWMLDGVDKLGELDARLEGLQALAAELPSHLHTKLAGFADEVRGEYRTLIFGTWATTITAALLFALFVRLAWQWILLPLRIVIHGSRNVAAGQFGYRIHLDTHDEMAELADAMNHMTARFEAIRDDLDSQVQERTKQVVRSEQLASVGFLAAGVAHEINNPLASIAMCAESLQGRVGELLGQCDHEDCEHAIIAEYLQMIEDEAFRCKEITEKLLDFSRIGQVQRQSADVRQLVQDVVEMVGHLGKYQDRNIRLLEGDPVVAPVNPSEIKQVVLNLLTNALDSVDAGGTVVVKLARGSDYAEVIFADDGCGMEPEVLEHVFEPFFTRRRGGQGTGLGLSITYRIVSDHGGDIVATSPGPGQGSTFRVRLPLSDTRRNCDSEHRAA